MIATGPRIRIRVVTSVAALTCTGVGVVGVANCVNTPPVAALSDDSGVGFDGAATDSQAPAVDSGVDGTTASDSGRAIDSAAPDTSATDSASPVDSAPASDAADAAVVDAADAAPDATSPCAPMAITGFAVPPYIPSQPADIFACNLGESQALGDDCYSDASTEDACAGFAQHGDDGGPVSAMCLSCLFTPEGSDAGYGAIIQSIVNIPNLAGCVEQTDQTDAGYACATAIQAAWECTEYACKTNCPITADPASVVAYQSCVVAAATGVCSAYTQVAQACIAAEEADAGGPTFTQMECFDGTTPLLEFFCGS